MLRIPPPASRQEGPRAGYDADENPPFVSSFPYLLTPFELDITAVNDASHFVDGLLVGAGEDPSSYDNDSSVEPSSWARIKASFK